MPQKRWPNDWPGQWIGQSARIGGLRSAALVISFASGSLARSAFRLLRGAAITLLFGDVMDEPDFDLDEYRNALRQRVLRAVRAAYATLDREARGGRTIRSEFQFRTCLALA